MLSKFLANVFMLAVLVGLQISVMIYGWGVTPKSWWWIVGVGFFGHLFAIHIAGKLVTETKD